MLQTGAGVTAARADASCDVAVNAFPATRNVAGNPTGSFTTGSTVTAVGAFSVPPQPIRQGCEGQSVTVSWRFELSGNSCGAGSASDVLATSGPTTVVWNDGTPFPSFTFTLPTSCPSNTPTPGAPLRRWGGGLDATVTDGNSLTTTEPAVPGVQVFVGAPNTSLPAGYGRGGKGLFGSQADPVNSLTGALTNQHDDLDVPQEGNPLLFRRVYNSDVTSSGPLGPGWTMAFGDQLTFDASQNATYHDAYGRDIVFTANTLGGLTYQPPFALALTLAANTGGTFTLTTEDKNKLLFDPAGRLVSVTDNIGRVNTLVRNGSGQVTEVDGLNGRKLTLAYTGGLLTSVTGVGVGTGGPTTRVASYAYTVGRLTSVTLPDNSGVSYGYDGAGRLATVQASSTSSPQSTTHYGADGRVDYQLDGDGNRSNWTWDPQSATATMTDPRGGRWVDIYQNDYLVRRVDPTGDVVTLDWNDNGDLFAVTDGLGNSTTFSFDVNHQLTSRYGPDGNGEQYTWSTTGGLNTETNPLGRKEDFSYLVHTGPSGMFDDATRANDVKLTPGSFDVPGPFTSVTDQSNRVSTLTEDPYNNMAGVTDPSGRKETETHDPFGDVLSYTPPEGNVSGATGSWTTAWTYDALGRTTQVRSPSGATAHIAYDSQGQVTSYSNPSGQTWNYTWDNAGYLKSVTPPTGPTVAYTYDGSGDLASVTAPGGGRTTYDYDPAGRMTGAHTPDGAWTYGYDAAGRRTTVKAPSGKTTTLDYNSLSEVTKISYSDGTPAVTYTYDQIGRRTAMTDGTGGTTYKYDTGGNLTTVTHGTDIWSMVWNANGMLTSRTAPGQQAQTFAYDASDRLTSVAYAGTAVATYTYDDVHDTVAEHQANGVVQTRTYNPGGQLTEVKATQGSSVLSDYKYSYDPEGNMITGGDNSAADTYVYDGMDRLTQVCFRTSTCTGATAYVRYAYDADGNLTQVTRPGGATTYTYDSADRLTGRSGAGGTVTYGYDADGNRTSDGTATYTYDGAGRTLSRTAGAATVTYMYDGDGRRTRMSTGTAATTRDLLWDPLSPRILAERNGAGATTAAFVYGEDPAAVVGGSAANSPVTWYTSDQINSIREARGANGALVGSASYEPYGVIRSTSGTIGDVGYADTPQAAPGGNLSFGARDYDPGSGTFTTLDNGGGGSPYGYADANPAQNVDPTGDASTRDQFLGAVHSLSGDVAGFSGAAAVFCAGFCPEAEPFIGMIGGGASLVNGGSGAILGVDNCAHGKGSCVDDLAEAAIGLAASRYGAAEPLAEESLALRNSSVEGKSMLGSGWINDASAAQDAAESCLNSFTGDTPVTMADGTQKPISQVEAGDKIIATDPQTGRTAVEPVVGTIHHAGDHTMVKISLAGGSALTATGGHLIWDATTDRFTPAHDLRVGDEVESSRGVLIRINAVASYDADLTAYNLQIGTLHTYYAGSTPVLVHNECNITDEGLSHSFFRHAKEWFGGDPSGSAKMAEWRGLIEQAAGSSKVFPWSARGRPTNAYLARIDGKYFAAQFDRTTGDLVTAFVPSNSQLGAMLRRLGH